MDTKTLVTDATLYKGKDKVGPASDVLKNKIIGVPCGADLAGKQFTPKLKKFYEEINKNGKVFEVIFVSLDKEEEDMLEYYEEKMPEWLIMEYSIESAKALRQQLTIPTIPSFKILKTDGSVAVEDARTGVTDRGMEDADGLLQEWKTLIAV
uniref:Thioredoxin-like_fold domain-containing protein n=1 Tax=Rhabditophanes sp. KR3021 TaxID=114890 RepID=A0AC35U2Z2_9BILA